jgi:hypothetical protein
MARYNTSSSTNVITGAATISSPFQGAFTNFTGTAPYTVILPAPAAFPGINQTFYNSTGGPVTISTPSGSFTGTGGPNASTFIINSGNVVSVVPDGTNYIVISEDGSPLVATTGSFSGNVSITSGVTNLTPSSFSLNPGGSGSSIDNVNVGLNARSTGAFTTLAANQAVTFTAGTSSSSTTTGTLVVTGGIGASGTVTASTVNATNLGGTLSTASQTNVTSLGTLSSLAVSGNTTLGTVSSAGGKVHIGLTGVANAATTTIANMTDFALSGRAGFDGLANNNDGIYFGMGINGGINAGIGFFREAAGWNSALAFYTNNVTDGVNVSKMQEKVRITSAGYVGIGISAPTAPLHISAPSGDGVPLLRITSTSAPAAFNWISTSLNSSLTTSASTTAHVFGQAQSQNNAGYVGFRYAGGAGSSTNYVTLGLYANDYLLNILGNGNVGVGTTTPQTRLDVSGNIIARGDLFIGTKPSNTLTTVGNNTDWHHIGYAGGTNYHITGSVTGDLTLGAMPGTGIIFGTATNAGDAVPVQRARIAANGAVSISNSLSVGTSATVGTTLDVTNGINFAGGYIRTAIYALNTYGGNQYVHMKTDQRTNNSNMYRFELVGYDYGSAQVLAGAWVGYLYSASDSSISNGIANWGNRGVCNSIYRSSDGYLVLVADIASYYCSFIIHFQAGATGTFTPTITSTYQSTGTGAYF